MGGSKFDHVTPILRNLHWLKIDKRIIFKISVLMFKCIYGLAPKYLLDKFNLRSTAANRVYLRVHDHNYLTVLSTRLWIGSRSFSVSGPTVWNSLRTPDLSIELLKKRLKSYMFQN